MFVVVTPEGMRVEIPSAVESEGSEAIEKFVAENTPQSEPEEAE